LTDSAVTIVPVDLQDTAAPQDRAYDIEIAAGRLDHAARRTLEVVDPSGVILVTDTTVGRLYGGQVVTGFETRGVKTTVLTVPAGERSKSVDQANQLWMQLLAAGADRRAVVVALGGGVVGDLAGFIAASFARGVDFVQLPTTLLAQVDSSVGGKVGINLPAAKNMVGAFWQPKLVLIDPLVLQSLPDREFGAGLAEVVKYGVIMDGEFFEMLAANVEPILARDPQIMQKVVARCCELKADVVLDDELETTGRRAILNYGHTFAHALESITGYGQLLHGEAVSIGMLCASRLAEQLGMISSDVTERQTHLLTSLGLPTALPEVDRPQMLEAMKHDKKAERGRIHFILPTRLGEVISVAEVEPHQVAAALGS